MSGVIYHVLVVDDDVAALRLLSRLLRSAGYRVSEAIDGEQALAVLERDCPSFLITDWEMPGMSGLELCQLVRAQRLPHYVYSLVLTGRGESHDTAAALNAGADDFLRKPIVRGELLARLRAGMRIVELEHHLAMLANSDPLTGLAAKRTFAEHLERDWSRAARYRTPLSCVMIDIDFFKQVNDTYGHHAGDDVIRMVAGRLAESCRASDFVARYGGEEFCALLPETDEASAALWAERLRDKIAASPVMMEGKPLSVTASFGVASIDEGITSSHGLVEAADQCLLAAKQAGRNRVFVASTLKQLAAMYRDPASGGGAIFAGVCARDVMTSIIAGLPREATVGHAARYFLRFRMSSAPVVDEEGKLVGFVSDKDLLNMLLWPDCWTRPIRDVMKSNVVCYPEETPILTIYEFLSRVPYRSIVVVRDGLPTGMISRGALLRWFSNSIAAAHGGGPAAGALTSAESLHESEELDEVNGRGRLGNAARVMRDQVVQLIAALDGDDSDDLLPRIVGGASRIQDLLAEILAGSHALRAPWPDGAIALADDLPAQK